MATALAASMTSSVKTELTASSPVTGALRGDLDTTRQWTAGQGSGQVDRVYRADRTLAAAATHAYNTLAAGGLEDIGKQTIDLDELKGFKVVCLTGSIKIVAPAGTYLRFFTAAVDGIALSATHYVELGLGATGIDTTTNSLFEITDTAGGAGSTYSIVFFGAN